MEEKVEGKMCNNIKKYKKLFSKEKFNCIIYELKAKKEINMLTNVTLN